MESHYKFDADRKIIVPVMQVVRLTIKKEKLGQRKMFL